MLKGISSVLSPELIKVLCEMGHSDVIVLGDGNFPGSRYAKEGGSIFLRADGHGVSILLDAVLQLIPTDTYVDTPVMLMQKMECDRDLKCSIWDEYKAIVAKYDPRGEKAIGFYDRFEFYEQAKKAYCIVQTGESAIYANVLIQKGVIK
jgi:L-fucose mutarotase